MNDQLFERCDLLVKNRAAIQRSFLLEKELMAVAAALVFTNEGREADTAKMKSCRKWIMLSRCRSCSCCAADSCRYSSSRVCRRPRMMTKVAIAMRATIASPLHNAKRCRTAL